MTVEELVERFDDLVTAVEQIAAVLKDVTAEGRVQTAPEKE